MIVARLKHDPSITSWPSLTTDYLAAAHEVARCWWYMFILLSLPGTVRRTELPPLRSVIDGISLLFSSCHSRIPGYQPLYGEQFICSRLLLWYSTWAWGQNFVWQVSEPSRLAFEINEYDSCFCATSMAWLPDQELTWDIGMYKCSALIVLQEAFKARNKLNCFLKGNSVMICY